MDVNDLPMGPAPKPVSASHFPSRLHAYVWRNWQLVSTDRLARTVGATPAQILEVGRSMGLGDPPPISDDQWQRTYITILRRNWHLLPYAQLLELLDWTPARMAHCLREGDGLFWWFGGYKPRVEPLRYAPPTAEQRARAAEIAAVVRETFPDGPAALTEPLFAFVADLTKPNALPPAPKVDAKFSPRFCFSYFGSFRNPLLGPSDPYPDGYLARLAAAGVDGVWIHEPLYRLTRFPWDPEVSERLEARLDRLRALVARAGKHGIGVYLYFNEPRPMPVTFFERHPELRGVDDTNVISGQMAGMCTSVPAVQDYLRNGVTSLCEAVPDLAGIFTITASESYTNCWSHHSGKKCPRCGPRGPQEVIAEVNRCLWEGIQRSRSKCRLIVWDWGWRDDWAEGIVERLPAGVSLMSVSEWSLPIQRGGVDTVVGEYALSVIGPGPRATRHWALARKRGLGTLAKIQASTTWELGAVPYIPVVENIATHVARLRDAEVDGVMMSWTLGGYPSPSFETVLAMARTKPPTVEEAMLSVARRRFGAGIAPAVVEAWRAFSTAFRQFPFHINVLYRSPVHLGPANPLWSEPTGYRGRGTMGFAHPLDDLETWRAVYPPEVFAGQLEKVADGFDRALAALEAAVTRPTDDDLADAVRQEIGVAQACAIHYRSVANQTRFVMARDALARAKTAEQARPQLDTLQDVLINEVVLATRLHAIQRRDSRIGFEAACHYLYVPVDMAEKVVNCRRLLASWLPAQRARFARRA